MPTVLAQEPGRVLVPSGWLVNTLGSVAMPRSIKLIMRFGDGMRVQAADAMEVSWGRADNRTSGDRRNADMIVPRTTRPGWSTIWRAYSDHRWGWDGAGVGCHKR